MPAVYYIYWLIHGEEPDWLPRRKLSWKEGYQLGLEKAARQQRWKRICEAYDRFGIDVDGVRCLPRTPEVLEFLRGKDQ